MIRKFLLEYWLIIIQIFLAILSLWLLPIFIEKNQVDGNIALLINISFWVMLLVAPISMQLTQVMSNLVTLSDQKKHETHFIENTSKCDRELASIQGFYKDIQTIERGEIFHSALLQQLSALKEQAEKYARYGKLEVIPNQSTTQPLLASLDPKDGFRFVHYADNNNFLLGSHSLDFMRELVQKIDAGETGKARRLIVITSDNDLLDPKLWLFLTFHLDHPGYSYRLISSSDYEDFQSDHGMTPSRLDFGLYGDKYAYQSLQAPLDVQDFQSRKPIGMFLAKQDVINNLTIFFDHCWNSHVSWTLPERFFTKIRDGIVLPASGRFGRGSTKKTVLATVDALASSVKSTQSIKEAFEKNGLTIDDLKNPNR